MKESRWLRWVGPGLIAFATAGAVATTATGAPPRPWGPRPCTEAARDETAARWTGSVSLAEVPLQPWYRLDPRLDESGALAGQRLSFGLDRERTARFMDLAPEAFAAGPFGRIVLIGTDDGNETQLQALDIAADCVAQVARERDVVRRATIDPTGQTIYEMRVDRATRADLGIWARRLDGSAAPHLILEPIAADARFGRTYSTEFAWDLAGNRLAVQSCGEAACRTRVLNVVDGNVATVAEADLGTMIGLDGSSLISYQACPGFPCAIVGVDVGGGERAFIATSGSAAVLTATPGGPRLVHEVFEGSRVSLRAVALDGSDGLDLGTLDGGLRLQAPPGIADAATAVPEGWVVLSPEGRLPLNGPAGRVHLRHVTDGRTVKLEENVR